MQFDLPFPHRATLPCAPTHRTLLTLPARVLVLRYVCERDHRPVEDGDLEFDLAQSTWLRRHDDERIQKMAECFLQSYLKKKS